MLPEAAGIEFAFPLTLVAAFPLAEGIVNIGERQQWEDFSTEPIRVVDRFGFHCGGHDWMALKKVNGQANRQSKIWFSKQSPKNIKNASPNIPHHLKSSE